MGKTNQIKPKTDSIKSKKTSSIWESCGSKKEFVENDKKEVMDVEHGINF